MKTRKASDIMTTPVVTTRPDAKLTDVIKLLLRHHISGVPVVDESGKLVGVITEYDIMNFAQSGDAATTTASEAMTKEVITVRPDTSCVEIIDLFAQRRIRRVPVVERGRVVGIVSRRDLMREMLFLYERY
jgi:CBS domain-containing protein